MSLSPKLEQTLRAIHDGTIANGVHFGNPNHPMIAVLVNGGHVTTDNTKIDPNDGRKVSVIVTDAGKTALGISPETAAVAAIVTQTQEVIMETAVATETKPKRARTTVVPEVRVSAELMVIPASVTRRGGNRGETYAFGKLDAPHADGRAYSFLVPATEANPDPMATLRAAVTSANARYKEKGGAVFKAYPVDENGVVGVRVFRLK